MAIFGVFLSLAMFYGVIWLILHLTKKERQQ